jgi:hypothetical protein
VTNTYVAVASPDDWIRFVLDEHLRGPLWRAGQRHNARAEDPIDVVRVGDPPDLPLGQR